MKEKIAVTIVVLLVLACITAGIGAAIEMEKQEARYPKIGDTIIFKGTTIVIVDSEFWSDPKIYVVRLPDWSTAKVLKTELIDIPIQGE